MVPHETVESRIVEALDLANEGERTCAIMGVPDEAKGEVLVLLTTREIDSADLRKKLNEAGVPNLWVPKTIKKIEAIPGLASGKLDLQKCKELAAGETASG